MMNTTDYEYIWRKSLIHVTDEFALPPVVLQAGEAIIGTLGNFSVSTGKAKAKKTFNVSAIVAAALVNGQVLEYKASFPESKRNILYFDTEQSPYHCQLVMQRILRLAGLPIDREPEYLRDSATLEPLLTLMNAEKSSVTPFTILLTWDWSSLTAFEI